MNKFGKSTSPINHNGKKVMMILEDPWKITGEHVALKNGMNISIKVRNLRELKIKEERVG